MWFASIFCILVLFSLGTSDPLRLSKEEERRSRILSYIRLPGVNWSQKQNVEKLPVKKHDEDLVRSLPESFDARQKWPNCPSLREIRDQGKCGCCWAICVAEAITDRVCIHSNGTKNFHFSAEDLMTCAEGNGCHGGFPSDAWNYWIKKGVVSGGNYDSNEGCKPYSIAPCLNHMNNCRPYDDTPKCVRSCRKGYNIPYEKDLRHGINSVYSLKTLDDMMAELYTNGPFTVTLDIEDDFANYTGGVYHHDGICIISNHAVKLMGWGEEGGQKYWLVANSWGTDFGMEGFFKILRGTNECAIESSEVVAALPRMNDF